MGACPKRPKSDLLSKTLRHVQDRPAPCRHPSRLNDTPTDTDCVLFPPFPSQAAPRQHWRVNAWANWAPLVARWLLGALFLYQGRVIPHR